MLAILIFMAQIPHFVGHGWEAWAMVIGGLAIIYGFPFINRSIPPPLVTIVVLTVAALLLDLPVTTVGNMGTLPDGLPYFASPALPLSWETSEIILPVSLSLSLTLAMVGLLESLLTASIVDDLTDTPSKKNRESCGQGLANIATGFLGGMAGCAMIGQSIINIRSGGLGRLSCLAAGVYLLFFILVLGDVVSMIPMPALVAVMIMVAIGTFDWSSLRTLNRMPRTDAFVLITTVVTVVLTHDLAKGVLAGVLLSAVFFVRKLARQIRAIEENSGDGRQRVYHVHGSLFFVAVDNFLAGFDYTIVSIRPAVLTPYTDFKPPRHRFFFATPKPNDSSKPSNFVVRTKIGSITKTPRQCQGAIFVTEVAAATSRRSGRRLVLALFASLAGRLFDRLLLVGAVSRRDFREFFLLRSIVLFVCLHDMYLCCQRPPRCGVKKWPAHSVIRALPQQSYESIVEFDRCASCVCRTAIARSGICMQAPSRFAFSHSAQP